MLRIIFFLLFSSINDERKRMFNMEVWAPENSADGLKCCELVNLALCRIA